jgi:galactokinase/mevalonate kinase-like predicted kinase
MKFTFSAPGRCGIVGNPTDMYGGSVISCSIRERAYVTVQDNDIPEIVVEGNSRKILKPEDFHQDGGMFDAVLAALEYFELEKAPLRITVTSEIPIRAGLSGSTAIMTALVAALLEWMSAKGYLHEEKSTWNVRPYKNVYMLAETVRHIELYFLKIVCGYQDAYMCTFGSLRFLDFRGKENYLSLDREPLGIVEDLAPFAPSLPIVLAHTGVQRISGSVHKPVRDRWLEGDPLIVNGVLRIAHIARMAKNALFNGDWDLLGEAMTENHEIVRSFGSSSEVNEKIIRIALDSGAIAAKLAGAGNGGTIIALHPEPEKMAQSFRDAGIEKIMFPAPTEGFHMELDGE